MNKTLITAIASAIAFILLVINTLFKTDLTVDEEVITSIATLLACGVMWFISHYWNQDYTSTAKKFTKAMRTAKRLAREGDLALEDLVVAVVEEAEKEEEEDDD